MMINISSKYLLPFNLYQTEVLGARSRSFFRSNYIHMRAPSFKLILTGEGGVGKDTFLKHYTEDLFEFETTTDRGVKIYHITFYTNLGPIVFNVWDVNGREDLDITNDAECAIIMYDATRTHYAKWVKRFTKGMPVVLVGNTAKVEDGNPIHDPPKENHYQYFEISVDSKDDCEQVFLWLAQHFCQANSQVHFVQKPVLRNHNDDE